MKFQFCWFYSFDFLFSMPTTGTPAHQASLSITNSRSLLKLMPMESVMPSNHLILCHPLSSHLQSFPASGSFPINQFFSSVGQSVGVSASASVLSMNIQDWSPLRLTDWIPLQSKGLSRVFSNKHPSSEASILQGSVVFIVQLSQPYVTTGETIALSRWTSLSKAMSLLFNMLSRLVIVFFQGASVF